LKLGIEIVAGQAVKPIFATFGDIESPNFIPYFFLSTPESMATTSVDDPQLT
jgi:hypothetical protein